MSDRKVFIHVGMQKTGSTWLQTIIFPQIESHDVLYKQSFRQAMYEMEGKDLLISYENYVGYPHIVASRRLNGWMATRNAALKNLSLLFPDADVILVIREQVDLICSLYNQYIKVGGSLTFSDYVSGNGRYSLEKDALQYVPLVEELKLRFRGRLLVMDFELFKANKSRFGEIFCDFIGTNDQLDFSSFGHSRVNASLSVLQLQALLVFNRLVWNDHSPSGFPLHRRLYKIARNAIVGGFSLGRSTPPVFESSEIDKLRKFYSSDWRTIVSRLDDGYGIL